MFGLSREEQQQARAIKPVQTIEEIAANLGMYELVEPTTLVDIHNAIREIFGDWARKFNSDGDGEHLYAFDAMRIIHEVSRTWARLHNVTASYRDKELRSSPNLCAKIKILRKYMPISAISLKRESLNLKIQSRLL